jgi:hypothetical protein
VSSFVSNFEANSRTRFRAGSSLSANLSASNNLAARVENSSALAASFVLPQNLAANFPASSALAAPLRVNAQPNVLLAAAPQGGSVFTPEPKRKMSFVGIFQAESAFAGAVQLDSSIEDGFTFFVTVVPTAFNPTGKFRHPRARLLIDNVETRFLSFNYSEPRNSIGANLSIQLARSTMSQINQNSNISFDLGFAETVTGAITWERILENGKLAGSTYQIAFNNDSLSFTAASSLADLFELAPAQPTTVYDGQKINLETQETQISGIVSETGQRIAPRLENRPNFRLYDALARVYETELGFERVMTNVPNYPITLISAGFGASWHSAVAPLLGMFEPVFVPTAEDVLWILDKTNALPAGVPPLEITVSDYQVLNRTAPARRALDGIVVTINEQSAFDYFTVRNETETRESGTFGTNSFTRTETERKIKEFRSTINPTTIVREELLEEKITTIQNGRTIGRETTTEFADGMGRKTGHTRTIETLVPVLPSGDFLLQTVSEERQTINYAASSRNPREVLLSRIVTVASGLIHIDNENTYLDEPFKSPILEAHRSGQIDPSADQETEFAALWTREETFEQLPSGQVRVRTTHVDHVRNVAVEPKTVVRTGDLSLNAASAQPQQILVTATAAGQPQTATRTANFATGELPRADAIALTRRRLQRINAGKTDLSLTLISVDLRARRGTIIRVKNRANQSLGDYLILGRNISGSAQGFEMIVDGEEI